MLLIKFQKENRLVPMKQGIFHFRPTQSFRDDPSSCRGDPMEGMVYGDPNSSFQIEGVEISKWIESIVWSKEYKGNILSLSLFQFNAENCHEIEKGIYCPNADAVEMMKDFGSSCIIMNSQQLVSSLEAALSDRKCNYEYHPIHYCDIKDHGAVRQFFQDMKKEKSLYPEFFLKDRTTYGLQNEWRFLIHDIADEFPLTANGGVNIHTPFRTQIPLFKTDDLTSLRVSKDFLL